MKLIVILALLVASINSYGKYYPGTLVFENGKSREGFVEASLGDVVLFKGWMEAQPEEIPAAEIKTIWMKTNSGHKMHEYHYMTVDNMPNHVWLKQVEKGVLSLYVHENVSEEGGSDKTEALEFYCLREGETSVRELADHNNNQVFAKNAPQFFADRHKLVEKIKHNEYNWENVQELVHNYNTGK
jgi:hypothetical protein